MKKNTNQQRKWSRLGVKLVVSVAILAASILLSPTKAQAFTLIERPASFIYVFGPVSQDSFSRGVRLNAANVFCPADGSATGDGSVRVLFKFFSGDGVTLMEETKVIACGEVASSDLPYIERTDVGGPHVYGLIAVLPAVQRPGNAQRGFCPSDKPGPEGSGPLATSFEMYGDTNGDVRQSLLPSLLRSCGK